MRRIDLPKYHQWTFADETKTVGKVIKRAGLLVGRLKKAMHVFDYPLRDRTVVRRFVKEAYKLIDAEKVDRIVCSYTPAEAVKAGQEIKVKRPDIKYIYYSLDTLSNESGAGFLPEKYRRSLGLQREKNYFEAADRIILMNCHKSHYDSTVYDAIRRKITYADFPLFVPKEQKVCENVPHDKTIIYAGSLYRVIRNPKFILDVLYPVLDEYYLDFYGYSDCDDIIAEYAEKTNGHVRVHGLVTYNVVQEQLNKADVLISIGNKGTEMAPSKIYEYISTGKPIIHVFATDNDPCVGALTKYENAFLIRENEYPDLKDLKRFIKKGSIKNIERLKKDYVESTPEFTDLIIRSV